MYVMSVKTHSQVDPILMGTLEHKKLTTYPCDSCDHDSSNEVDFAQRINTSHRYVDRRSNEKSSL